jgi:NAD(P)-dependent dehydrogenase (short-subunit alcohol dehydrogenase family)
LVTGGCGGIGSGLAATLAAAGAHVILADFASAVAEAAAALAETGSAEGVQVDLTDDVARERVLAGVGPVDILVNCAGTNRPRPFVDIEPADFDKVMDLNVRASYFTAQAVARRMIAAGLKGSIIHLSSQMGHVGAATRTVYCASKWAVEGMTKAMAIELAPYGIRVNALAPTFILTPMTAPFFENEEFKADALQRIKLGRLGTPADLSAAILFLASDASSLMTGSSLLIDGGWTAD